MAYVFNSDLLLNERDREAAREAFPDVYFALDNQRLRETFRPYDERANEAKTRSRQWGVFAVLLATGALLLAGGEVLYHDLSKTQIRIIAGLGGVAGIVSVIIAVFGVMFRDRKTRWLSDRTVTERLRQFHFQSYAAGAAKILAGAKSAGAKAEFERWRGEAFERVDESLVREPEKALHDFVHTEDPGEGLLFDDAEPSIKPDDPHLNQYFEAFEALRLGPQISYCEYILREGGGFWKRAPVRQAKILGAIAMASVLGILILHGFVFLGAVANIAWMKAPLVHVLAIWAAIIALSARTFEEGFQPELEIERMRAYKLSLQKIAKRFRDSDAPAEKVEAMWDLEKLSYEEMLLFLKRNYEAEFVM